MSQTFSESIQDVASLLEPLNLKRLFLVLDEAAYEASGAKQALATYFTRHATAVFSQFEINPKLEDVQRGIRAYRDFAPDFVIALGGGTAIDLAKLIGAFAAQETSSRSLALGEAAIVVPGQPMMAIPTTAGTGSEATHFAVVYVDGDKYSVAHPSLLPRFTIVDATLTESLPRRITVATGLDTFCQAIESIWAVAATEESMAYAMTAAQLAFENLTLAANAPTFEVRRAMCRASHLAGKAINLTKTTAPHALSYFLTSRFGVPHGMAVATTLVTMLAFNAGVNEADCVDPRGADAVRARMERIFSVVGASDVDEACAAINRLLSQVQCPTLQETGVGDALSGMVDSVNLERLSNNPRRATRVQLLELLSRGIV